MIRKLQQSINSKLLAKLAIYLHSAKTLKPQSFSVFLSFPITYALKTRLIPA